MLWNIWYSREIWFDIILDIKTIWKESHISKSSNLNVIKSRKLWNEIRSRNESYFLIPIKISIEKHSLEPKLWIMMDSLLRSLTLLELHPWTCSGTLKVSWTHPFSICSPKVVNIQNFMDPWKVIFRPIFRRVWQHLDRRNSSTVEK